METLRVSYNGISHLPHNFLQHRVVRAFLIEEQKIVKKVLAEKSKKPKKADA